MNDEKLLVYLTDEEHKQLEEMAAAENISVSEYIRRRLDETKVTPPPSIDWKSYLSRVQEIGRTVNRLAAQGNSSGWIDPDDFRNAVDELDKVLTEIEDAQGITIPIIIEEEKE